MATNNKITDVSVDRGEPRVCADSAALGKSGMEKIYSEPIQNIQAIEFQKPRVQIS